MVRVLLVLAALSSTIGTSSTLESAVTSLRGWRAAAAASKPAHGTIIHVDAELEGDKLTGYLRQWLSTTSRAYDACKRGEVLVNGVKVYSNYRLRTGDQLRLDLQSAPAEEGSDVDERLAQRLSAYTNILCGDEQRPALRVLWEDEDLAVVLKPSGVHALAWTGTLKKNALALDDVLPLLLRPPSALSAPRHALQRPLPCHRLDARVSGCLLVGKTVEALAALNKQFEDREIRKEYSAVLAGNATEALGGWSGSVTAPVNGLAALSDVVVESVVSCNIYGSMSRVRLFPHTGRRHQLRQHCAWLGTPIIGDDAYHNTASHPAELRGELLCRVEAGERVDLLPPFRAVRERGGLFLASTAIEFTHPVAGGRIRVGCEAADKFENILARAKKGADWMEAQS